ncbi:hypothetical protein OUY24_20230 [Nonomuraea ferruginea]|uniref:Uncharacterized protein n=1 Tax=Nonomuraea ferruginea TaxID=46174 RepID=A0ABT4T0B1_9ACTN|nr:hypothetical protein [Nonomuraea ferruginea]MDA0642962.1 hypothetical protein [Nonomuraea ferruginea]
MASSMPRRRSRSSVSVACGQSAGPPRVRSIVLAIATSVRPSPSCRLRLNRRRSSSRAATSSSSARFSSPAVHRVWARRAAYGTSAASARSRRAQGRRRGPTSSRPTRSPCHISGTSRASAPTRPLSTEVSPSATSTATPRTASASRDTATTEASASSGALCRRHRSSRSVSSRTDIQGRTGSRARPLRNGRQSVPARSTAARSYPATRPLMPT